MSTTLKKLAGAALAAAITLGGITSAYAQFYNEPLPEEPVIENVVTDEDESLDGLTAGLWIYKNDTMSTGHEWVGLAGGKLSIKGLYHNFWDIYHKGGTIKADSFDVHIDRFWATPETLNASRSLGWLSDATIDTFILQVGQRDVHGETFGVKKAGKLTMDGVWNSTPQMISCDGNLINGWGVKKNTKLEILNCAGGVIDEVQFYTGTVENQAGGFIGKAYQADGVCYNDGEIGEYTMVGGTLENTNGYIGTLYYRDGYLDKKGMDNVGEIIFLDRAVAGMDEGVIDNAVIDEADSDDAAVDNAGWQDAAPLGEEVMVW